MTDRDEDVLARLPVEGFTGVGYRHQRPGFDPVSGAGARRRGGRYNPPQSFAVLYLALDERVAAAELRRASERQGVSVRDALPQELFAVDLELVRVVDLRRQDIQEALGVGVDDLVATNQLRCRQIGTAASQLGIQALLAPSAAGEGTILAVFLDNLETSRCDPRLVTTWTSEADPPI